MGLGTREFLLVLRAKDQASRIISDVGREFAFAGKHMEEADRKAQAAARQSIQTGKTLMGVGAGIGAIGVGGLAFLGSAMKANIEYNTAVAKTLTQVDDVGASMKNIGQIGIDVARQIPAPFEQMQGALYDIFSSTNSNMIEAKSLLTAFSTAAVAGFTDVENAGDATISIMNGFKIPASEINRIMDVQFQTVKKGRIEYDEYARTIGRAIPSAVKAGQSVEDLGGMMAFLTRNGLSAAMSATSAARALDLLTNPKFKDSMKGLGVSVVDASGNFRPMVDVITDLKNRLAGMTSKEQSAAMTKLFAAMSDKGIAKEMEKFGIAAKDAEGNMRPLTSVMGDFEKLLNKSTPEARAQILAGLTKGAGGTIQAMRFVNLAITDQENLFQELTGSIRNSGGAMSKAYKIAANTPAAKIQAFKNEWKTFKITLVDDLMPALTGLIKGITGVVKWFGNLSPEVKRGIAIFIAISSVLALLIGTVTFFAGAIMVLSGAWALLSLGVQASLVTFGWILIAFAALVVAGVLLYKNWDTIKAVAIDAWNKIKEVITGAAQAIWDKIGPTVMAIKDIFVTVFGVIKDVVQVWWNNVMKPIIDAAIVAFHAVMEVLGFFSDVFHTVFNAVKIVVGAVFDVIFKLFEILVAVYWNVVLKPMLEELQGRFTSAFNTIAAVVKWAWETVIKPIWHAIGDYINTVLKPNIESIKEVWDKVWNTMGDAVKTVWESVKGAVTGGVNFVLEQAENMINRVIKVVNLLIDTVNKISTVDIARMNEVVIRKIGDPGARSLAKGPGRFQEFAEGGVVQGAGKMLAYVHGGEGVLTQRAMSMLGENAVSDLNSGRMPSGGSVVIEEGAFQVNVYGATDPQAVGRVVDERLEELLRTVKQRA